MDLDQKVRDLENKNLAKKSSTTQAAIRDLEAAVTEMEKRLQAAVAKW